MSSDLKAEAREVFGPEPGEREAVLTCMADVQAEKVQWLWPSRFALGKLALLVGDPSVGKSLLSCAFAAAVSRGAAWPDGVGTAPLGSVVMLNAEDGTADTIKPRLEAAGAECSKIHVLDTVRIADEKGKFIEDGFTLSDVAALESAIEKAGDCKLVVVDPVSAFMAGTDTHKNADVRGLLKPLGDLAQRRGVAVLLVSHLNKSAAAAMYRTTGSLAFVAAARTAWCCVADRDDPTKRMMLMLKNNLAPNPGGLGYTIKDGMVQWLGRVDADLNAVMAAGREDEGGSAVEEAENFLRVELAEGRLTAGEVEHRARAAGHKKRTLDTAKRRLGIESKKIGPTWFWEFPNTANVSQSIAGLPPCNLGVSDADGQQTSKNATLQDTATGIGFADLSDERLGEMADDYAAKKEDTKGQAPTKEDKR